MTSVRLTAYPLVLLAAANLMLACDQSSTEHGWRPTMHVRTSELAGPVTVGGHWAFVPNMAAGSVTEIDMRSERIVATIQLADPKVLRAQGCAPDSVHAYDSRSWGWRACDTPYAIAWDGTDLLALDNGDRQLIRVDPEAGRIVDRVDLPGTGWAIAADSVTAWVSDWDDDAMFVVNLASATVVATISGLAQGPSWITVANNTVWLVCARAVGRLYRIDATAQRIIGFSEVAPWSNAITAAGGAVFVRGDNGGEIARLDGITGDAVWRRDAPAFLGRPGIDEIAVVGGDLWLSGPTTQAIDLRTGRFVGSIPVASEAVGGEGDDLWLLELDGSVGEYRYTN
jgi:DNA-binding beta-propeller fold protein YncE